MRRRESGFSLLELVIALAIVAVVLAAASTFFIGAVRQYKVQTKIVESNLEGILGLELLRQDLESGGFGLPWSGLPPGTMSDPIRTETVSAPPAWSASRPPPDSNNGSDYLIIQSVRVGMANAAGKWTTLRAGAVTRDWGRRKRIWTARTLSSSSPPAAPPRPKGPRDAGGGGTIRLPAAPTTRTTATRRTSSTGSTPSRRGFPSTARITTSPTTPPMRFPGIVRPSRAPS